MASARHRYFSLLMAPHVSLLATTTIVRLVRFVLLLLLFNFVMHGIISTVVDAFEINYLI